MNRYLLILMLLGTFEFTGCNQQTGEESREDAPVPVAKVAGETPKTPNAETRTEGETSTQPEVVDIKGVKFTIPAGWKRADLTPAQAGVLAARYLIPVEGEDLQLTFSVVGGGIENNFDRWRKQFQLKPGVEPIQDLITLADGEAHWLDLRGTYTASTGFTASDPESDIRMIGVGIPLADGAMYLKLLGPEPLVARITDDMRALVKSADLP